MLNSFHDEYAETQLNDRMALPNVVDVKLETPIQKHNTSKAVKADASHDHKIEVRPRSEELLGDTILIGQLVPDKKIAKENITKAQVSARLTTKEFIWANKSLSLADIVSISHVLHTRRFIVHSFPFGKSMWPCSRKSRKRKDFYFLAPRPDEAAKWAAAFESLKCFVNYSPQPLPASKRQASTMDAKESPSPHLATTTGLGRAMLVILNPRSGSGRARKIYDSKVEPVLKLAGLKLTVVETNGPNHAQNLAATADLSTCMNGIICVGGDGIVNEVLNGVVNRDDIKQSKKIPIGIIPAGSDNSLVWSVLGIRDPVSAAIAIVKGDLVSTDILSVDWMKTGDFQLGHTITYYGFMSDVLELSEKYQKKFGPLRYFVAGALKFLCLSAYECEIEYLPVPGQDNEEARDSKGSIQGENAGNFDAISDIFTRKMDEEKGARSLSNRFIELDHVTDPSNESSEYVRGLDSKLKWSPPMRASMPAEIDELLGLNHSVGGPVTPSPRPRTRSKSRLEKGWSSRSMGDETSNSVTSKWNPKQESSLGLNLEADISGPVSQNHPKSPVFEDDKWVLKQGPFLGVMVCNHKCKTVQCAKSQTLAPNAKHDGKTLDLLLVHDVGRFQLLRFLVLMQFGCHLSLPFVECTKVQSVKLKPGSKGPKGCGIDGELVSLNGPITITLHEEQWHLLGPLHAS